MKTQHSQKINFLTNIWGWPPVCVPREQDFACLSASMPFDGSLVAQTVKRLPAVRETKVRSLGEEDPLEKEMATHSSTLAWKILWTEEPSGLQSMGLQRVGHDGATSQLHFMPFDGRFKLFAETSLKWDQESGAVTWKPWRWSVIGGNWSTYHFQGFLLQPTRGNHCWRWPQLQGLSSLETTHLWGILGLPE